MTPAQCRARDLLDWTQAKLAEAAGLALATLVKFEQSGRAVPARAVQPMQRDNSQCARLNASWIASAVRTALEAAEGILSVYIDCDRIIIDRTFEHSMSGGLDQAAGAMVTFETRNRVE